MRSLLPWFVFAVRFCMPVIASTIPTLEVSDTNIVQDSQKMKQGELDGRVSAQKDSQIVGLSDEKAQEAHLSTKLQAEFHFTCPMSKESSRYVRWMATWTSYHKVVDYWNMEHVNGFGYPYYDEDAWPYYYSNSFFSKETRHIENYSCTYYVSGHFHGEIWPKSMTMTMSTDKIPRQTEPLVTESCELTIPGRRRKDPIVKPCLIHRIGVSVPKEE